MTLFRKRKSADQAVPEVCHICGERLGTVHIQSIVAEKPGTDWWLCERCSLQFRRNDAESS